MDKYYEAPSNKIFEEVKKASTEIWETYDNQFGYVDEKVGRIKGINNIQDNTMYMVAMFDHVNRAKLLDKLSDEAKSFVSERIN